MVLDPVGQTVFPTCACACVAVSVMAASKAARRAVNLRGGGGKCLELLHDAFLMVNVRPHYTGFAWPVKG